jgi:hypothetical protein
MSKTHKMRTPRLVVVLATMLWLLVATTPAQAGLFTFDTLPADGVISGAAGSTLGWGYTLANPSTTDWLVLVNVSADVFEHALPSAILFDLPVLGPEATLATAYVAGALGLFELTWDATAPLGFANSGTFIVSAEWWSGDPLAGGSYLGMATDQSATYSVSVMPSATVPEPSSLILLTTGVVAISSRLRRRTRQTRP